MPTIGIRVEGKVQGVFYRASAKQKAMTLRLSGWVKNTADGAVLIRASGDAASLKNFKIWCAAGPADAVVTNIMQEDLPEEIFPDFRIIRG